MFHTIVVEAQNDALLIKKANSEFQSGNYSEAINDYRQLLSKDPKSIDFNFKYATCLYHTDDINKATKFYDLILNMYDPPKESYFYRGKIYQNNYDFQKAIKSFEKYKSLMSKKDLDLGADTEINHCKNALQFIKAPGTFKTIKRFEANRADFFQNYSFTDVIYSFYDVDDVYPKQNSKNNHKLSYAFIRGMKYRFFASYGTNVESGKDIYIQKKSGETGWADPIRLGPEVNSNADEDFPFFDEEKGVLYFSSAGHNSMGGYDIFKVDFDLTTNTASNRQNLNFPFSSPNDDLFLIPDLKTKNAYFASNRNGQLGKVEVFYIELSEKPIELTFISGKLTDRIDELNKGVQIKIINEISKEQFGPFYSDEEGNYLVSVPKAGTYKFQIKVSGSAKEFSESVDIPKINDSKKLNQEILYSMNDSKEKLEVITRILDKENLSAKMELIKYKEMAKLDVNAGTLVTEIKTEKESDLADLGYSEDSVQAFEKLTDDLLDIQLDIEKNLKFEEELISKLDSNQIELENLNNEIVSLNKEINSANDVREKYKLETEKRNLEKDVQSIKKQNYVLAKEIQSISENKQISRETLQELKAINEELNEKLINSNYDEAKAIISNKKKELSQFLDNRLDDKEKLEKQKESQITEEKINLESQIAEQVKQINELKNQISTTQQKLNTEKNKKEQERIQTEIKQLNKNLNLVQELNAESQFNLTKLEKEQEAYAENKEILSKIDLRAEDKKSFQDVKSVPKSKLQPDNLINEIVENETVLTSTTEGKYEQDIARIQKITNEKERKTKLTERENQYQAELKQKLESSSSESEKEIISEQIQLSQSRLAELDENVAQNNQNEKVVETTNNTIENNFTSIEVAKNEVQTSNQKEKVEETSNNKTIENNSTSNEVAKNEVQTSNQKEKVEETSNN
ncbi:MAG: tetratricopeptide repeat protein, partial [Crocinitomicaceae bacterium]